MPEKTYCNICGSELDEWDLQEDFTLHKHVGYGSKYDLSEVKLHICCRCFDNIVDQCMITPIVRDYD